LVSAFLLPAPTVPAAVDTPPAEQVVIDIVTVNGSGCPVGTVSVSVLPDNTGFQLNLTDYRAVAGGGAANTAFRKNCQLNLAMHVPEGFTYAITRTDYRGRMHVEPGATAVHRSNFYYSGLSSTIYRTHTFAGPIDGSWQATDVIEPAARIYPPCGQPRNLNINSELRVNAGTSPDQASWISMSASDAEVHSAFQFEWRKC
jgi:hypothetical protein